MLQISYLTVNLAIVYYREAFSKRGFIFQNHEMVIGVDGEAGDHAVSPVTKEQKLEQELVMIQLHWMVEILALVKMSTRLLAFWRAVVQVLFCFLFSNNVHFLVEIWTVHSIFKETILIRNSRNIYLFLTKVPKVLFSWTLILHSLSRFFLSKNLQSFGGTAWLIKKNSI